MTATTQIAAIMQSRGGEYIPAQVTGPSYDLLCKLHDLTATAHRIRGALALHGDCPALRIRTAKFATLAKWLLPASCGSHFQTMVNLKTEWPKNWKNHIDLSAHIEGVMRSVREVLEGAEA